MREYSAPVLIHAQPSMREQSAPVVMPVLSGTPRLSPAVVDRTSSGTPGPSRQVGRSASPPVVVRAVEVLDAKTAPLSARPAYQTVTAVTRPAAAVSQTAPQSPARVLGVMAVAGVSATKPQAIEASPGFREADEVRKDADEQVWWSESVRKITASIDQKLNHVVITNASPELHQKVAEEVDIQAAPTRTGPPADQIGKILRSAAFDYQASQRALQQNGCRESTSHPGSPEKDNEIPSALRSLKSMRRDIEVLWEKQLTETPQSATRSTPSRHLPVVDPALVIDPPPPLPAPRRTRQRSEDPHENREHVAQVAALETRIGGLNTPTPPGATTPREDLEATTQIQATLQHVGSTEGELSDSGTIPIAEPSPGMSVRQEQQELRIQALQAKVRHLEQQVGVDNATPCKQSPRQDAPFWPDAPPSESRQASEDMDRLLDSELSTFRQEIKAQYMEHSLGVVQEANVLRKDVSLALRNEREARSGEVGEMRAVVEGTQERLMQELHETMDLMGARLEHHLQEAVHPDRLCELLSSKLELTRFLQRANNMQHGSSSDENLSREEFTKQIEIERDARCRSVIDLRVELQSQLREAVREATSTAASAQDANAMGAEIAESSSVLQAMARDLQQLTLRVDDLQSLSRTRVESSVAGDVAGALEALARGLEDERLMRANETQELANRIDALKSGATRIASEAGSTEAILESLSRQLEQERKMRTADFQQLACSVEDLARSRGQRQDGDDAALALAKVDALSQTLQEERDVWRTSMQELQYRVHPSGSDGGDSAAQAMSMLKNFARELDEERESRSSVIQDLHIRIGRELAEMRQRDEAQSRSLEQAMRSERDARVSESTELRALLDHVRSSTR